MLTESKGKDSEKGFTAHEQKGSNQGDIFGAVHAMSKSGRVTSDESRRESYGLRRPRKGTGILVVVPERFYLFIDPKRRTKKNRKQREK